MTNRSREQVILKAIGELGYCINSFIKGSFHPDDDTLHNWKSRIEVIKSLLKEDSGVEVDINDFDWNKVLESPLYKCPECNDRIYMIQDYCSGCGQKLIWSKTNMVHY